MALRYIRQLYSLDTLDTRFVVPANAPPKEALELANLDPAQPLPVRNGQVKSREPIEGVQPSRWNTLEFKTYGVLITIVVFFMFKSVLDVSIGQIWTLLATTSTNVDAESHPNYSKFSHLLEDGWIPGRKVVRITWSVVISWTDDCFRTIPTCSTPVSGQIYHICSSLCSCILCSGSCMMGSGGPTLTPRCDPRVPAD